jgi:hypothetical protein
MRNDPPTQGTARQVMLIAAIAMMCASLPMAKPSDQPTEIRVQVMDSRTHRPLKGRRVEVSFLDKNMNFIRPLWTKGRTGPDGVMALQVKQPIPPRMDVFILFVFPCSDTEDFSTQEVLGDGLVAHWTPRSFKKVEKWCTADSKAPQLERQPGKLILFVHPMNPFVWIWYGMRE